jgi:hypothetical protein
MRNRNQVVNPAQQPGNRHYERERRQYGRDEERDFARGADYTGRSGRPPRQYENRDYSPKNWWEREYRGQAPYAENTYPASRDYGYERDEYYEMDPARSFRRQGEVTGYGNVHSQQGRDFEEWLHGEQRRRDFSPGDFRDHSFPGSRRRDEGNRDFEEGMYDYRQEQMYNEGRYRRDNHSRRPKSNMDHKYQNRSDRHIEIVRPFKEPRDYGRNDYNHSEGFGRNEMAYHDDHFRDREGEWVHERRRR